jgi:hypothetical protein
VAKKIAILFVALSLVQCDDDKKPKDNNAIASPSALASALGIDAATLGGAIDPERPAGDLAADIEGFTTVEACVKKRTTSLDPLVGDAVDAIGYDTFLRDACRVLEAAKTKDAKVCKAIDSSALRNRCRTVTAMVSGDPDGCPLKAEVKPELGRDASCVAAAMRSMGMCAGASKRDRPSCEALLAHDPKRCDALALEDLRVPCMRDATRFRGVVEGSPALAAPPVVKGTLTVHGDGRPDPTDTTADLEGDIGMGVVVVLEGKRTRLAFGRFDDSARAATPLEHTRFALSVATEEGKPVEVIESALTVPGAPRGSCAGERCAPIAAKVTKLEPKRGGAVELSVDGVIGGFRVKADVRTFCRDVVDRTSMR